MAYIIKHIYSPEPKTNRKDDRLSDDVVAVYLTAHGLPASRDDMEKLELFYNVA